VSCQQDKKRHVCVLIDGTIRRVPVAAIEVDTPFIKGQNRAVCMRNPLYDLIIGHVSGVTQSSDAICQAVMTRQQINHSLQVRNL